MFPVKRFFKMQRKKSFAESNTFFLEPRDCGKPVSNSKLLANNNKWHHRLCNTELNIIFCEFI
jgi:hypothetical protein